jgi:hypothetical protein
MRLADVRELVWGFLPGNESQGLALTVYGSYVYAARAFADRVFSTPCGSGASVGSRAPQRTGAAERDIAPGRDELAVAIRATAVKPAKATIATVAAAALLVIYASSSDDRLTNEQIVIQTYRQSV